jgi:hypothetical protein
VPGSAYASGLKPLTQAGFQGCDKFLAASREDQSSVAYHFMDTIFTVLYKSEFISFFVNL